MKIVLNKEGVETSVPDDYALQEGEVFKQEDPAPDPEDDIDYEKEYHALLEKEAKTEEEKENYRIAFLKLKGKLPDDHDDPSDIQGIVAKEVQKALIANESARYQKDKEVLVKKILDENKELKRIVKTREGIQKENPGSSIEKKTDVKTEYWTPEQIKYFQSRGLDPNKVKENHLKYKSRQD